MNRRLAEILVIIGAIAAFAALVLVIVTGGKEDPHQKLVEELEAAEQATERVIHEIEEQVHREHLRHTQGHLHPSSNS